MPPACAPERLGLLGAPLREGRRRADVLLQFAFAPENLTTFAHFSVSSTISLPNSAGDRDNAVPPSSVSFVLKPSSARMALTSVLSLSMMEAGVFFAVP